MKNLSIKELSSMEIACLSSIDLEDAEQELRNRGVPDPTFEQSFDMLSSMRTVYSNIFYSELCKLRLTV